MAESRKRARTGTKIRAATPEATMERARTSLSPVVFGRVPQTEDDHEVDGRDDDDEAEHRQHLDQAPTGMRAHLLVLAASSPERDEHRGARGDGTELAGPSDEEVQHRRHERDASRPG